MYACRLHVSMSKRSSVSSPTGAKKAKVHFDPEAVKRRLRTSSELRRKLDSACADFRDAVSEVMQSDSCLTILQDSPPNVVELCLAAYLGLEGAECLRLAQQLVPRSILHLREAYVNRILAQIVPTNIISTVTRCADVLTKVPFFTRDAVRAPYIDELRRASELNGKAHTSFLAPPTTNCINSACPRKGDAHSLYIHHTEVEVTVFTLTGPLPATKVSLRCKACLTVYNYSKFGRKGSEGERYYDERRPFIELSDVAFCTRDLHALYTALW